MQTNAPIQKILKSLLIVAMPLTIVSPCQAADINTPHKTRGKTILMDTVNGPHCNEYAIAGILNIEGVQVNATDTLGNKTTALMIAADSGCVKGTEALLKQGADWKMKNRFGKDALDLALESQQFEAASAILTFLGCNGRKPTECQRVEVTGVSQAEIYRGTSYANAKQYESRVAEQARIEAERPKLKGMTITLGFSMGETDDTTAANINAKLEGKYQLNGNLQGESKVEVFYSKQDDASTERYLLTNRLTRKDLFFEGFDGTLDKTFEHTAESKQATIVLLVERSLSFFSDSLKVRVGAGPGLRWSDFADDLADSGTDMTFSVREKADYKPGSFLGYQTPVVLTQNYEGDYGEKGNTHRFGFGFEIPLNERGLSIGMNAIYYRKGSGEQVEDGTNISGQIKQAL